MWPPLYNGFSNRRYIVLGHWGGVGWGEKLWFGLLVFLLYFVSIFFTYGAPHKVKKIYRGHFHNTILFLLLTY